MSLKTIENAWSSRADAHRRSTLYYKAQVKMQGAGFEPAQARLTLVTLSKIEIHLLVFLESTEGNCKDLSTRSICRTKIAHILMQIITRIPLPPAVLRPRLLISELHT